LLTIPISGGIAFLCVRLLIAAGIFVPASG
jgi:hypothetical protein